MDLDGELDALIRLMPPPAEPLDAGEPDAWPSIELRLGLRLPSDYKAFIARYGSGSFADFISIYNPFSENPHDRLLDAAESEAVIYREIRTFEHIPYPIHPEPGGLLAWGSSYNGDVMFWVADPPGDPDQWPIAISEVRGPGWYRHPGPLVRFFREWLTGETVIPFISQEPRATYVRGIPWPELEAQLTADRAKWQAMPPIPPPSSPPFSWPGPGSPDWPPTTTPGWIDALRRGDGMGRGQAAEHLATLGEPILPELIALLDGDEPTIWIVRAILGVGDAAVPALIEAFERRDGRLDWALAQALGGSHDERVLPPLLGALTSTDDWTRAHAAMGLGILGRSDAAEPLVRALGDPFASARLGAVVALGVVGDGTAAMPARDLLGDSDDRVRAAAARTFGRLGGQAAVELLAEFMADAVAEVRVAAIDGLGATGSPEAASILLDRLPALNPRLPVREELAATIRALGGLRDERARGPLRAILDASFRDWEPVAGEPTFGSLATAAISALDGIDTDPLAGPL
jgi:HEAT repeat protein